jgi:hypothetical protein
LWTGAVAAAAAAAGGSATSIGAAQPDYEFESAVTFGRMNEMETNADAIMDQLHGPDEAPASNTNDDNNDGDGKKVSAGARGASGGHEASNGDVLPDTPMKNVGHGDSQDQGATAADQPTAVLISVNEGCSKAKTSPTALPPTVRAIAILNSDYSAAPTTGPPTSKAELLDGFNKSSRRISSDVGHVEIKMAIVVGTIVVVFAVAAIWNITKRNRKLERAMEEDARVRGCSRDRDIESM